MCNHTLDNNQEAICNDFFLVWVASSVPGALCTLTHGRAVALKPKKLQTCALHQQLPSTGHVNLSCAQAMCRSNFKQLFHTARWPPQRHGNIRLREKSILLHSLFFKRIRLLHDHQTYGTMCPAQHDVYAESCCHYYWPLDAAPLSHCLGQRMLPHAPAPNACLDKTKHGFFAESGMAHSCHHKTGLAYLP